MKPEELKPGQIDKSTDGKAEVWHFKGAVLYDSVGCDHHFVQKTATTMECRKCGLGLFGQCVDGKLA